MNPAHRPQGIAQAARSKALRSLVPALVLLACGALPLAGQEAAAPRHVTLSGQVTDRSTGRPLPGVVVEVEGTRRQAMTDQEGRFTLKRLRPGEHRLLASLLGYRDLERSVAAAGGEGTVALAMDPDPVLLEGLTVKLNLLERRRRMVAAASRVFGREQIRASASPNMEAFVRGRGGAAIVSCDRPFADACVWSRGSYVPVSVYLDEIPIYSMGHLMALQPEEVERVEIYQHGRQVRVYTSWFMEQVARGRRRVDPIFFW